MFNPMFRLIGRLGERELFVVAGLFTVIAAAALMHALGLSVALGAFVAGVMLAESPYRHELESDVEPFRSILLGLFFMSVGMLLDLGLIAQRPLFVIGLALAVIVIKALILTVLARGFGNGWPRSFRLGLLLSQAGEFGFVLFASAASAQLILPEAASLFGAVVTLSMAATPFLMKLTERLEQREEKSAAGLAGPEDSPSTRAIVVGYGRFGQTVGADADGQEDRCDADRLEAEPDRDQRGIRGQGLLWRRHAGRPAAHGRGPRPPRRSCSASTAKRSTRDKLTQVIEAFPQAQVMVRVFDRRHVMALDGLDLAFVQREVFESAVSMGRAALKVVGLPGSEIDRVEREYRSRDSERLERQSATGDLHAASERMFSISQTLARRALRRLVEEGGEALGIDRAVEIGAADAVGEDQGQRAAVILFVAGDPVEQARGAATVADVGEPRRQPGGGEVHRDAVGVGGGAGADLGRVAEGEDHSDCHRLAVEQGAEPGFAFDGVAEAVAEVEQGAPAGAVLDVAGDDPRLGADRGGDGVGLVVAVPGEQAGAFALAPGEESGVVDQAIFDHFGIAGAKLARVERVEEGGVGDDQRGLVKAADEILFPEGVDRGLAADRAVGLREQGGRQMDDRAAALEQARRRARPGRRPSRRRAR